MIKRKSVGFQSALMSALIGLLGVIIGAILVSYFNKRLSNETRMYELKQNIYSDFLDQYHSHFKHERIDAKYREVFDREFSFLTYNWSGIWGWSWRLGSSGTLTGNREESEDSFPLEEIYNNVEKAKKCYYSKPGFCEGWENEDLGTFDVIGDIQSITFRKALRELLVEFNSSTHQAQLIMPEKTYDDSLEKIQGALFTAPNSFYGCKLRNEAITGPGCGFNFETYQDDNGLFSFFSEGVIDLLKKDLQSHYSN